MITLDTIEEFLTKSTLESTGFNNFLSMKSSDEDSDEEKEKSEKKSAFIGEQKWYKNIDYFRIDGSVSASKRSTFIENFNNPDDPRAR